MSEPRSRRRLGKIVLPGFKGVPLGNVLRFVFRGFGKGVLVTRASSIAFNMLMAFLPASIFLFTLIPFIPVPNLKQELIRLLENITPTQAYSVMQSTIIDVITKKSSGFLIFMFIATIVFSTNGIHATINAFVVSSHRFRSRTWVDQRKISIILLIIVFFMVALAGSLLIGGKLIISKLVAMHYLHKNLVFYFLVVLKWLIIAMLIFLAISFLYWLAPAKRSEFRFISPGSIIATFLFILTSIGFSAYVNNFGQYNRLYGSIGTLIVIMIWLYLNSIALLIGFELNVSIKEAREENRYVSGEISYSEETGQPVS
ncbi:MAG TPA: YihY/virulence factor BrkB family protein [Bacteroidales bacterium]|nr:YihY/virulence factor BrkB family protein [Bacteroidales bacterium]